MSLIAWYPLNVDTNDHSGNNYNPYSTTGTISQISNGKIGKSSYSFASGNLNIDTTNLELRYNMTISFWVYINAYPASRYGILQTHYGAEIALNVDNVGSLQWYYGTSGIDNLPYVSTSTYSGFVTVGAWTHVTLVRDVTNNQTRFYKNGVHISISDATLSYIPVKGTDNILKIGYAYTGYLNGDLNDVRFYDNVLSDKEIIELAKAKYLHYTFNDFQEPTTNLLYKSGAVNLSTATDLYSRSTKTDLGYGKYLFVNNGTGVSLIRLYCNLTDLTNAQTYGCSIFFETLTGTIYMDWCDTSITGSGSTSSNIDGRLYGTGYRATYDSTYRFLDINLSSGCVVILFNPQVEHKLYVTDFVNGSRTATVNDISGHNSLSTLTESNSPRWTSGRLGEGGYLFDGISSFIHLNTTNFYKELYSELTVSCWIYPNRLGGQYQDIVVNRDASNYNWMLYQHTTDGSVQLHGVNQNKSTYIPTINVWTHIVATVDSSQNSKLYANGILVQTVTGYDYHRTGVPLILSIGNFGGASEFYLGQIDDVRIYGTALSSSDVLELYNTRAQLDKSGNLFLNEIITNGFKPTLIDYSKWVIGTNDSQPGFSSNGQSGENTIIVKNNPINNSDVVWATLGNDATSDGDGGWTTTSFNIDNTKKYRSSVWIRRENVGNGTTYFGCLGNSVWNLGTTTLNNNPYFIYTTLAGCPQMANNWVLFVSYIFPTSYTGTTDSTSGVYTSDGSMVKVSTDYKWSNTATVGNHRTYLYYSTSTTERQYWYRPRFEVVDGSEPSISELLICNEHKALIDSSNVYNKYQITSYGNGIYTNLSEVGITDGLVGFWKLNGDIIDYAGLNIGSVSSNVTVASGIKNLSYSFNGTSSYINLQNSTAIQLSNSITISAWVYPVSVSTNGNIVSKSYNQNYRYRINTDNTLWFYVNGNLVNGGYVSLNTWSHCVATGGSNGLSIYINGVSVSSNSTSYVPVSITTGNLYIGTYNGSSEFFNGKIQDVKIYNRKLNINEINILYKNGIPNTGMQLTSDGNIYLNNNIIEGL